MVQMAIVLYSTWESLFEDKVRQMPSDPVILNSICLYHHELTQVLGVGRKSDRSGVIW
jgi:hypothetical protein